MHANLQLSKIYITSSYNDEHAITPDPKQSNLPCKEI
jgi:hypothetical protein